MILVPVALAVLSGAAAPAEAPLPSPSLLGSGLLTLPDARTLPRGRFSVATTLHNRDRDPLGIDVFDYSLAFSAGLGARVEGYGRAVFSRVVVLPDANQTWPALPPPPLDLVVPQGMTPPGRPYYAVAPGFPFVNGRGDQRFSDLVPGDLVLGAKARLRDGSNGRAAFAAAAEVTLPLTRRMGALQSGSSTGGVDLTLRALSDKEVAGFDLVTSLAVTIVGGPPHSDRLLEASTDAASIVQEPLQLPSRLEFGVGLRRPVSSRVALVGEAIATFDVYGAETLDRVSPLDLLIGLQARHGRARLTAGLLYAGGAASSGSVRTAPLAGFVDLSRVAPADVRTYLEDGGMGGAAPHLREGVQVVAPRVPGVALPEGARVIPETYTILSEHQVGFVAVLGWSF